MGPSKFKGIFIELNNPARSYFAGQVVQGHVVIQNDKPKKVKEVTILLEGSGRVRWSETETYTTTHTVMVNGQQTNKTQTHHRTIVFAAEEKYITQKLSLAGDGHNLITIPVGTSTYPFQFILPRNLPSSFTSQVGLISYFLEAEIRKPFLKPNKRMALPFTVNGIFDLNLEMGAAQSQEIKKVKGSNFFACRKGQIGFVLNLKRSGFVPGETVLFSCEITNGSNSRVKSVKAFITQVTTFYAQGRSKFVRKNICEVKGPSIDRGDHEMWVPDSLTIPPVPPTRLGGNSRIIDVQYFFQLEMSISGLSMSLSGELPIMVGTIPLRNTFEMLRPFSPAPPLPVLPGQVTNDVGFKLPTDGPSTSLGPSLPEKSQFFQDVPSQVLPSAPILDDYPDLPPPSYAEAVSTERFTWEGSGNENQDKDSLQPNVPGSNDSATGNIASAPPMYEFVPNYITYNKA